MRTIQTENATYRIADSRNLEDFVKQLKKPKSLAKRFKADKKTFPAFVAGGNLNPSVRRSLLQVKQPEPRQ